MNRQCGLRNSKYAVILDPLSTGHVTQRMCSELLALNMSKCKFEVYISLTVPDRCMVTMDHPKEVARHKSIDHVIDLGHIIAFNS